MIQLIKIIIIQRDYIWTEVKMTKFFYMISFTIPFGLNLQQEVIHVWIKKLVRVAWVAAP